MTHMIQINRLEDTTLWKCLEQNNNASANRLAANLVQICQEASERMKAMPAYAPQYTLHDERHLLRTTELMALILGPQNSKLNIVELTLLILAAFFHDQGMVPSQKQYLTMRGTSIRTMTVGGITQMVTPWNGPYLSRTKKIG